MARYVMAIDSTVCMNCKACVVACQQRNLVPYEKNRNWVLATNDATVPGGMAYQPGACMHCDNPVCVTACPTNATYKVQDGSVVIDQDRCIGCGGCIAFCPYGARFRHPATGVADKCDYCRQSPVQGQPPACALACPTHCRTFGDAEDPADPVSKVLAGSKHLHVTPKGVDTMPTLTYLNRTTPTTFPDVPGKGDMPLPLEAMTWVSKGIQILGGLAFFGVIGVFFKQIVWPSEEKPSTDNHEAQKGEHA